MNLIESTSPWKYWPNTDFRNLLKFDVIIIVGSTGTGKSFLCDLIMENNSRYTYIGNVGFHHMYEDALRSEVDGLLTLKKPFLLEYQIVPHEIISRIILNSDLKWVVVQFTNYRYNDIPLYHYQILNQDN